MSEASRASKRRCLARIVGNKYVSDSALADILKRLKGHDLSNLSTSSRSGMRALEKEVNTQTRYGHVMTVLMLPLEEGDHMQ